MYFLKTKNGYPLSDVVNALQKSIRRGKTSTPVKDSSET
jgi:hypothetical protein